MGKINKVLSGLNVETFVEGVSFTADGYSIGGCGSKVNQGHSPCGKDNSQGHSPCGKTGYSPCGKPTIMKQGHSPCGKTGYSPCGKRPIYSPCGKAPV